MKTLDEIIKKEADETTKEALSRLENVKGQKGVFLITSEELGRLILLSMQDGAYLGGGYENS